MKAFVDTIRWAVEQDDNPNALACFIAFVLCPHVPHLDARQIFETLSLSPVAPADASIRADVLKFHSMHDAVISAANTLGHPTMAATWARYYMDSRRDETRFVRGCRELAKIFTRTGPESAAQLLDRLTEYCANTDILKEIFNEG